MPVKSNWANGEQFNASDANDVAAAVNAAYVKPGTGIPSTDLASAVQTSLGKADSALQSVSSTNISDATTTGKAVLTAADAAAARTTLGVAYGTTAGTVTQGNDSRLSPSSTSITDSTATGRSLITATDASAARTTLGVAYGTTSGTVAQGNDSRITGAEQTSAKNTANGYCGLDSGGKVSVAQLPSSIMEYQGTYNASTNSPSLSDGTGNAGDVYRVSVAGTRNFGAGNIVLRVGDYVIYSGTVWQKSATTDNVASVAGLTGDVTSSSLLGAIATGTPSSTTYLRGDGTWTAVSGGITRSISTITTPTTLANATSTDYVYFIGGEATVASLLLHMDGANNATSFSDSSGNALTITRNGDTKISTTQSKFGGASAFFDGSGDDLQIATNALLDFGSGNFTWEAWVFPTSVSGEFSFCTAAGSGGMLIGYNGGITYGRTGVAYDYNTGVALSTNTWSHIAITRSGTSIRVFLNGTQAGATQSSSQAYNLGTTSTRIGSQGGSGHFSGYIDEMRILKGSAAYTANFTAPTAAFADPAVGAPTLPTAVSNLNEYCLVNKTAGSVAVGTTSSQTINGSSSYSLTASASARFISDGSAWYSA